MRLILVDFSLATFLRACPPLCEAVGRLFFWLLGLSLTLLLGVNCSAQPTSSGGSATSASRYVVERSLYSDETGSLGIEAASKQSYQPVGVLLSHGPKSLVHWIKLQVSVSDPSDEALFLAVGPYFLSKLELYYESQGRWIKQESGAMSPKHSSFNCFLGKHCFNLPATNATQVQTYFLRIDTINGFYMSAQVLNQQELLAEAIWQNRLYGIQLGFLLMLIGWSAIYFLKARQAAVGLFCWSQIFAVLFSLLANGLLFDDIFVDFSQHYSSLFNSILSLRILFVSLIGYELIRRWQAPRWYIIQYALLTSVWGIELLLAVFGQVSPFLLALDWIFLLLFPFMQVVAIAQCKTMPAGYRKYLMLGFILLGCGLLVDVSFYFAAIGTRLSVPGGWIGAISGLGLYLIVLSTIKSQQEQLLHTMFEFNTLKVQNNYEQIQLKERKMLIDMLSHELKNPLATMRMALGSIKQRLTQSAPDPDVAERLSSISQSIDNMNAVIERCGQVDAFDQTTFVARYETVNIRTVIEGLPLFVGHRERLTVTGSPQRTIEIDLQLFATILNNLIDNALKYSHAMSMVEIDFECGDAEHFRLSVSNYIGANDAPDPAALFTRYYRSPYAHDKPGTGLGLVLVKSLCELLNGTITYRRSEQQVFFVVEFPA